MGGGEGGGGMRGVGKRSTGGGHMHRAGGGHMHRASGGHNKIHVAAHQKHQNFHKQAQDRFKKMQQDHRRQQDRRRRQELAFGRQQVAVFRKRNGLFGHKKWRVTGLGQRRRQHRARNTGRSGSSGGPGFFLSCCFGIQPKTPTQRNQEDIQTLQRYQNKLIECHQQELALKQAENTNTSDAVQSAPSAPPPTNDKVMAQGAHELQREQHELLNDILDQLREETDPERLEELYRQQRELIGQMEQLHAAGFQNAVSIQPVHPYGRPGVQTAPVAEVMVVDMVAQH